MKHLFHRTPESQRENKRLFTVWVLRAFSDKRLRNRIFDKRNNCAYEDQDIAEFLGLPDINVNHSETLSQNETLIKTQKIAIFRKMESKLCRLEAEPQKNCFTPIAQKNFQILSSFLKLNPTERAVLEFFVSARLTSILRDTYRVLGQDSWQYMVAFLAGVLKIATIHIHKALHRDAKLMSSGMLVREIQNNRSESQIPRFFSNIIASEIFGGTIDEKSIISHIVTPSPLPTLNLSDYTHLEPILSLLIPYLKKSVNSRKKGVNIFIHGRPGTGKSELARLLSSLTQTQAYEVPTETEEGTPAEKRIHSLRSTTTFLQPNNNLLIFDEAEDIFSSHSLFSPSAAQSNKGWINRLLENNKVPIIWISNDADCLDNAFIRRFDFIFEVSLPPRDQRKKAIHKILGKSYSENFFQHLSQSEHISPAVISRAGSVISGLVPRYDTTRREAAVSLLISNTLKAQGHPDPFRNAIDLIDPATYDLANLNCSADLGEIARALAVGKSARICLYGPPGTGKTSFGHWLANELSLPLHCKKVSDILTPYLGETEKNMARAFEAARLEKAILLIDEVDSFLRDRTLANRSWEISQVNEFLTQMESFPGIFLASTNLKDNLDPASLRRFDLKLHFDYLRPEQSLHLLYSHSSALNLTTPSDEDIRTLQQLPNLTPGDFANVARQCRFHNPKSTTNFIQLLLLECEMKLTNSCRKIGFIS